MAKKKAKKRSYKMKAYANFDLWLKDQSAANQSVAKEIRKLVKETSKKLEETVKWGNGCWTVDGMPVCYNYADKDHVQFGFFVGVGIPDPKKILEGNGKYLRFIRLRTKADIPKIALKKMIKQAMKIKY